MDSRNVGPAGVPVDDDPASGVAGATASGGGACSGFGCPVHACASGGSTTISGTIYDPAGKSPLYGVVAYVPNTQPEPFAPGASCSTGTDLYTGDPIASAVTDPAGRFVIQDAPDGVGIPLVIQVGKWRRQLVLPRVDPCTNTAVPDHTLTLPKNGGEGDLPNIAVSTGTDSLECLLSRIGVDRAEYVGGAGGTGHIHVFKGAASASDTSPGAPDSATWLWDSARDIMRYDMVLLSCEGQEPAHMNQRVLFDYAAAGGRVFASHFHYAWFSTGPFGAADLAAWTRGQHQAGMSFAAGIVTTTWANQPFPRGEAFYEWLSTVGALAGGGLPLESPPSYNAYVTAANPASQPWIVVDRGSPSSSPTLDFSFDTPLGAPPADQCGRVVFSDMHVGPAAGDYGSGSGRITPAGCATKDLSPQEKALEFVLFDLSSGVTPGNAPPQGPAN